MNNRIIIKNVKSQNQENLMDKLKELKEKALQLENKIKKLESDLKTPLKKDPDENALGEENREIILGLIKVEKENLLRIKKEIANLSKK
jgi:RNA polymerase-binding transcription factor DksA